MPRDNAITANLCAVAARWLNEHHCETCDAQAAVDEESRTGWCAEAQAVLDMVATLERWDAPQTDEATP